jgi:hypothetical protein
VWPRIAVIDEEVNEVEYKSLKYRHKSGDILQIIRGKFVWKDRFPRSVTKCPSKVKKTKDKRRNYRVVPGLLA